MAYKLQTAVGRAIHRLRKCTVEPLFGALKEALGYCQFSLRGLAAVSGEWCPLCPVYNLKRLHTLLCAQGRTLPGAALFAVAGVWPRLSWPLPDVPPWERAALCSGSVC
jgi:hypothetical protein